MENIHIVQRLQTLDHLDEDAPDIVLLKVGLLLLMLGDFLEKITIVGILHHNAELRSVTP